jgi:hypothetical protein
VLNLRNDALNHRVTDLGKDLIPLLAFISFQPHDLPPEEAQEGKGLPNQMLRINSTYPLCALLLERLLVLGLDILDSSDH